MMMKILFIENDVNQHYETIESVIVKHKEIIGDHDIDTIYVKCPFESMPGFEEYLTNRFPDIKTGTPEKYDFYINCTIYPSNHDRMKDEILSNTKNKFYICHRAQRFDGWENVIYCMPNKTNKFITFDHLPFMNEPREEIIKPTFIIQGRPEARDHKLLERMLCCNEDHDFHIKIIGKGKIPDRLVQLKNRLKDKLMIQNKLEHMDFAQYHEQFLQSTYLLPMVSQEEQPHYYDNCLTSSISYAKAYNLCCILDWKLQSIYNVSNAIVYNNGDHLNQIFNKITSQPA